MRFPVSIACLILVARLAAQSPQAGPTVVPPVSVASPDQTSVLSRTGQFRVSGGNSTYRGAAAILAEEAKDEMLKLLGVQDDWKVPVAIVLHGKPGDVAPARTTVSRLWLVEGSAQLQLDKHLAAGLEPIAFKQAVTSMLVYERSLRSQPQIAEDVSMSVPTWLAIGIREASEWRMNRSNRAMYAALFRHGGVFKLEEIFAMDDERFEKADAATKVAFRVSAGSLVMALLGQPEGSEEFREFLGKVASYQGEMPMLLRAHFKGLNLSEHSLAKWWALQLANQGDLNPLTEVMGMAETEAALEKCLVLDLVKPGEGLRREGLGSWREIGKMTPDNRAASVKYAQAALTHLSYRCFPSYRPLLVRYQQLLYQIFTGHAGEWDAAFEQLRREREEMLSQANRGRDYLDWFEITRARQTSGAFDDFLRLKQEMKEQRQARRDGVSSYLDRMDEVFSRDPDEPSAGRR